MTPTPADFASLAGPARRALQAAGIGSLADLSKMTEAQLAAVPGMGPNALRQLRGKLEAKGMAFKAPPKPRKPKAPATPE